MSLIFFTQSHKWGSGLTRGCAISDKLGVPCNPDPKTVTGEDTVVMVKVVMPGVCDRAKKTYCDIVDGSNRAKRTLIHHPEITIITQTPQMIPLVQREYPDHKIIWLPHAHCNHERRIRPDRPVKTVIYNGMAKGFPEERWGRFDEKVKAAGFRTLYGCEMKDREHLCDLYLQSDIAVSYRKENSVTKAPSKLHNAASFRIPTVANPEPSMVLSYDKSGSFVPIFSINEMVEACVRLRDDKEYYDSVVEPAYREANKYHIDNVVELYKKL